MIINYNTGDCVFNGYISILRITNTIVTLDQFTRFWNETKGWFLI